MIARVSDSPASVLITGESGTGKELVARAIHVHGARHLAPFVAVNCGALTETLLESELFGHVKGSFTGAVANKPGIFEQAQSGTVFLDEVSEMSTGLQVKLLRVLQEREVVPVGGSAAIAVNARVIAASNRDPETLMSSERFRHDLLYRLKTTSCESILHGIKLHLISTTPRSPISTTIHGQATCGSSKTHSSARSRSIKAEPSRPQICQERSSGLLRQRHLSPPVMNSKHCSRAYHRAKRCSGAICCTC